MEYMLHRLPGQSDGNHVDGKSSDRSVVAAVDRGYCSSEDRFERCPPNIAYSSPDMWRPVDGSN